MGTGGPGKRPSVYKFGGTSVTDGSRFRWVAAIVAEAEGRADTIPIVVVSAMAGVTDALLRIAHLEVARQAVSDGPLLSALLQELAAGFVALGRDVAALPLLHQEQPARADAASVAAWGERLAVLVTSAALQERGVPVHPVREELIITAEPGDSLPRAPEEAWGTVIAAEPLLEDTRALVNARLLPLLERGGVPVVPGFIARSRTGQIRTLGRGGSDLTATVLAAAIEGCLAVYIYSDVDGVLSANPLLEPHARLLPRLSYREAARMARLGAKVLHPATLAPVAELRIPVYVRNTFRPREQGTLIAEEGARQGGAVAVLLVGALSLLCLESPRTGPEGLPIAEVGQLFSAAGVRPLALWQACQQVTALVRGGDLAAVWRAVRQGENVRVGDGSREGVSACVCLGAGLRSHPGAFAAGAGALAAEGISPLACFAPQEDLLLFLVDERQAVPALHCLHASLVGGVPGGDGVPVPAGIVPERAY